MARRTPGRSSRGAKTDKSPVRQTWGAEEKDRLSRALARERARRRALEAKLADESAGHRETATSLDAAREHQAATAEILDLISRFPGDAQPVFDAIARHAVRLCGTRSAIVVRYDGTLLHLAASHNVSAESIGRFERYYPAAAR